jgi:hypothetical protein
MEAIAVALLSATGTLSGALEALRVAGNEPEIVVSNFISVVRESHSPEPEQHDLYIGL